MSKRNLRPLYPHDGYTIPPNKFCYRTVAKLKICTASGKRSNGYITITKPHTGHDKNDGLAMAKIAKIELKELASTTTLAPRDLVHEVKTKHGVSPVVMSGSASSMRRLISRVREENCQDARAADSANPVFKGKMAQDNDMENFLIFDEIVPQTRGRNVAFGNQLALDVLGKSKILLTDGTFAVAQAPFLQLWSIHATFGDSTIPVVHVLMTSRSILDYSHVLEKLKAVLPNWSPTDYLGDLEIGQARAVANAFPGIQTSFCYFHLLQSWYRNLKKYHLDGLVHYGGPMYPFWSLLRCLPYGDVGNVEQDFRALVGLLPTPLTPDMQKFEEYLRKFYIGPRQTLMFPPATWNVSSRTLRHLPRTTNAVEALHRNLERCVRDTRGRTSPLLSELLKCLRQEASKLKFDKEALDFDPTYEARFQKL
ncbi:CRE-SRW-33 protein [Caenorhabditis remanei]|uniref:CRE-SRW-33 protein n=1 Tax=Caenorhabditis remanei TaxID=31234 RepID=E3NAP3_CAERE|nr:CRE-SRW-33 protein [Caenorhabditis remanei]